VGNSGYKGVSSLSRTAQIEPTNDNGLSKRSAVDTFQVRSVSQQRLIKQIGTLSDETMDEVSKALGLVLDIGN
jgi:mRNA interferase MazF